MSDRLRVLGWVLVAVVGALLIGAVLAVDACECCTDPVVKVEWADEWVYEFTDGSIVVTGTERLLCYEVVSGTAISEIRTEAGQDIECWYPQGAENGCLEAGKHDFSNALFCKEDPTAVELSSFKAEGDEGITLTRDHLYVALALIGVFLLGVLVGDAGR